MNPKIEKYKEWYEKGVWTKQQVDNLYNKGKITEKEYKYILDLNTKKK